MTAFGTPVITQIPPVEPVAVGHQERLEEKELDTAEDVERLLKRQILDYRRIAAQAAFWASIALTFVAIVLLLGQSSSSWFDWVPYRQYPDKAIFLIGGLFAAPTLVLVSFLKAVFQQKDDDKKSEDKSSGLPITDAVSTVVKTLK